MNYNQALAGAYGILRRESSSPRLDAEILLAHAAGKERTEILAHPETELPEKKAAEFGKLVRRRAQGEPIPYLTGTAFFYGLKLAVNPSVLVPRPETEDLVRAAVSAAAELPSDPVIADIGTGSGNIAVATAVNLPKAKVVAVDRFGRALRTAWQNAKRHKAGKRITFIESDLLNEIPAGFSPHIILANLPYVASDELKRADENADTRGLAFEPQAALEGGPDGLQQFRRFFGQLKRISSLRERLSAVILEHAPEQYAAVAQMAYDAAKLLPEKVSPFVTKYARKK